MTTITTDPRFNGPPDSGNGGYVCGSIAEAVGRPVRVALRVPPPLGRALEVAVDDDGAVRVTDGEVLVATATPFDGAHTAPPTTVTLEEAAEAARGYAGLEAHVFPTCWVCGPARPDGDGLHIYTGPLPGHDTTIGAATWTPGADLDAGDGTVASAQVWAALDCPSFWGGVRDRFAVLGQLAVTQHAPIPVGEPHVVLGWATAEPDGRKLPTASAVVDADGTVLASATAMWIELTPELVERMGFKA